MAGLNKKSKTLLQAIVSGSVTRVSQADGLPLLTHSPPLIEVNTNDVDAEGKALVRATSDGMSMIAPVAVNETETSNGSQFEVITNAVLPARKRLGRAAGTSMYPFDKLDIGGSFFVAGADKVKKLASTISAQNMKYAEKTGQMKTVERTKRGPGNKAVLDGAGNKVKETATVPEFKFTRKFAMRGVKAGQACGAWVAPADGVLISRVALD